MGVDTALVTSGEPETASAVTATVVELLPRATYRVELEDRRRVLAHVASGRQRNFIRVRIGDRVQVALSPKDPTRGRITGLL